MLNMNGDPVYLDWESTAIKDGKVRTLQQLTANAFSLHMMDAPSQRSALAQKGNTKIRYSVAEVVCWESDQICM